MSELKGYRDLIVWQKAMDLAEAAYQLARSFPQVEEYRLTNQLLRAAASIPANIAEGSGRGTRKDFAHFVAIAYGSLCETETHLMLVVRVGLAQRSEVDPLLSLCREIGRMLNALRVRLRGPKLDREETGTC